jgi:hypothetical protein
MISSPCKDCPKVSQPKSVCSKNCQILKMVQEVQLTKEFEGSFQWPNIQIWICTLSIIRIFQPFHKHVPRYQGASLVSRKAGEM